MIHTFGICYLSFHMTSRPAQHKVFRLLFLSKGENVTEQSRTDQRGNGHVALQKVCASYNAFQEQTGVIHGRNCPETDPRTNVLRHLPDAVRACLGL